MSFIYLKLVFVFYYLLVIFRFLLLLSINHFFLVFRSLLFLCVHLSLFHWFLVSLCPSLSCKGILVFPLHQRNPAINSSFYFCHCSRKNHWLSSSSYYKQISHFSFYQFQIKAKKNQKKV